MKILHVVGARPNFMKVAPIIREMTRYPDTFEQFLVHTGQHYDELMSQVFFADLDLPHPDLNLEVGSGTHTWQTAEVMRRFEPVVLDYKPDWVVVVGDVNSTLACTLVCSKIGIPVAHVEAGLRSFDRSMPEEINRLLTDQVADLLFTPSLDGDQNLKREGVATDKIHFVGNVMIDTLVRLMPRAEGSWDKLRDRLGLQNYVLVTIHRPSNVDDANTLGEIMSALSDVSEEIQVFFPLHPRTKLRIDECGLEINAENLHLMDPCSYLDFLALQMNADLVITDSGGVQEETTYLGVPCLTVRPNTERPVTITSGTNRLVESTQQALVDAISTRLRERDVTRSVPPLWDGHASERVVRVFKEI
ncbi:UDP-N-acetylglucosamine 2-epimerase (non-hydrolyzing) [Candidatus Bathyarchaeota archaeon]|nr:UDP-N-acetylglucosamine 2-epimerase (non-hydrolyzing) [Candidatus Bathyarchaeota archaeon]